MLLLRKGLTKISLEDAFKIVIGFLVERYGELAVDDFSPKRLRLVRDLMIQTGRFCRSTINDYTRRIIRIFQWVAEEELVDPSKAWDCSRAILKTVNGYEKTRSNDTLKARAFYGLVISVPTPMLVNIFSSNA